MGAQNAQASRAMVLVVDDDEGLLRLVDYTLSHAGYQVVTTAQPENAVRMAESRSADAVVLDIMMPGRSGYDVIAELRGNPKTAGVPILVLSALSEGPQRVRGLREGADDYMCKPLEPEELVLRLERLLARSAEASAVLFGRLGAVSVAEVIQIVLHLGISGVFEISSGGRHGRIVVDGNVARGAEFEDLEGQDAAITMLSLSTGSFRFRRADDEASPEDQGISLQSVLFTSAWLDDELGRRPEVASDELLWPVSEATDGPPPTPEGFESLPLLRVWECIRSTPGISLDALLAEGIGAPGMVRLAVSILVEHGALCSTPIISSVPADDSELGPAQMIRRRADELVAVARAQGVSPDLVHVLVIVEPTVHGALLEMRHEVPSSALAASGDSLIGAWHTGRVARLPLLTSVGTLVVHLVTVDADKAMNALRGRLGSYCAVAAWVSDPGAVPRLRWVVDEVATGAGHWWGLFIAAQPEAAAYLAALLEGASRWSMHRIAPKTMAELLGLLAAAGSM
jgi:DNA-binding response OmpR family regulator